MNDLGRSKKQKYIPIHDLASRLPTNSSQALIHSMPLLVVIQRHIYQATPFASAWKVFKEHYALL